MLGPAWFDLGGRRVQPFAVAPWADDTGPEHDSLPPLLKRLRGEWPCVPFGFPDSRTNLPSEWASEVTTRSNAGRGYPHGYSSNAEWGLSRLESDRIELMLEYPKDHPIERVIRTITASRTTPKLEIFLRVHARNAADLPIGLHPVLKLPQTPAAARLYFHKNARAWTFPVPLEPGISRLKPNVQGAHLRCVPSTAANGHDETEDLTRLPLTHDTEELVLVVGSEGEAWLVHTEEHYAVRLAWDSNVFRACMLWLSNRGRQYYPWNGRFLALGIEPVRSAFDLGTGVSRNRANPLWQAAVPCTYPFSPEHPLETSYSIAVTRD